MENLKIQHKWISNVLLISEVSIFLGIKKILFLTLFNKTHFLTNLQGKGMPYGPLNVFYFWYPLTIGLKWPKMVLVYI